MLSKITYKTACIYSADFITTISHINNVYQIIFAVTADECNVFQWTCMNSSKTAMLICFSVFGFLLLVIIGISVVVITKQNV